MTDESIGAFFQRACQAVADGDLEFWGASVADDVLVVGSAPGEVIEGRDEVLRAFTAYGAIPCEPKNVRGRMEATVGWAFGDVVVAGGETRLTLIASRAADNEWTITHWHLSVAVQDEEVFPDAVGGG